jgi:hypothetical protein
MRMLNKKEKIKFSVTSGILENQEHYGSEEAMEFREKFKNYFNNKGATSL